MPNACTVCAHEHRHTIEVGLANKVSAQTLGKKYGLSRDAILRHARNHLTPQMRAAILTAQAPAAIDLEQLRKTESEGLLSQLVTQRARLEQHTDKAAADGDLKAVAALEGQVLKNLALVGKLLGQFAQISGSMPESASGASRIASIIVRSASGANTICMRLPIGYAGAFQAIGKFELDAFITIIAAGADVKPAEIENDVFRAGVRNIVDPVARFVSILSNGGEDPEKAEAA